MLSTDFFRERSLRSILYALKISGFIYVPFIQNPESLPAGQAGV